MDARAIWLNAIDGWLHSVSDRTRGTYVATLRAFVHFQQPHVWEITTRDVEAWVASMEERGLSASTVQQNISVVSSFYKYAVQQELLGVNPVDGVVRVPVYTDLPCLSIEQARDVLSVIPDTVQGRRDYALLLAYVITGDLDARLWRWGEAMPDPVREAVRRFFRAANRPFEDDAYVFTGLGHQAAFLPNVTQWDPGGRPLSVQSVNRLLRRYVKLAGIEPDGITVRSLRSTAAQLHHAAGQDVESISEMLGITADRVEAHVSRPAVSYQTVAAMLGC